MWDTRYLLTKAGLSYLLMVGSICATIYGWDISG